MKDRRDTDGLGARLQRNAPDVRADRDWADVHARMLARSGKRTQRRRGLLIGWAATCIIAALAVGGLLALEHFGRSDFVVVIGDGPALETAAGSETTVTTPATPTTPTTVITEFQVQGGSLTDAWLKVADGLGFEAAHASCDELEIDYMPSGDLVRLHIHGYVFLPGESGVGVLTVRSQAAVSPGIELSVTLDRSEVSAEYGVESQPVLTILAALETIDPKQMIARVAELAAAPKVTSPSAPGLYRLTTTWNLLKREDIPPGERAIFWDPASGAFDELAPQDELRRADLAHYVHAAVLVVSQEESSVPESSAGPGTLASLTIHFVLPIPDQSSSGSASETSSEQKGSIAGPQKSVTETGSKTPTTATVTETSEAAPEARPSAEVTEATISP